MIRRHLYLSYILVIIFTTIAVSSVFDFSYSEKAHLLNEIESINNEIITNPLYIFPSIKNDKKNYMNIFKNSKDLKVYPVFAARYSSSSFEIFQSPNVINSDLLFYIFTISE